MLPKLPNPLSNIQGVIKNVQDSVFNVTTHARQARQATLIQKKKAQEKYRFPARIEGAKVHKNATKFGIKPKKIGQNTVVCPCCGLNINTQQLSLFYQTTYLPQRINGDELQIEIPCAVALFFTFIKLIIIYLMIRFLVTDMFNIYSSYAQGTYCQENQEQCQQSIFTMSSGYNKINQQNLIIMQDILNLVTVLISIPYFIFYRQFQYRIYDSIDKEIQTEDDYAIFIQNIPVLDFPEQKEEPLGFYYRAHIQKILKQRIDDWLKDLEIFDSDAYEEDSIQKCFKRLLQGKKPGRVITRSVNICYDMNDINKIQALKRNLMDRHEQIHVGTMVSRQSQKEQKEPNLKMFQEIPYSDVPSQIEFLNESQIALAKKFSVDNSVMFNMTHFVGKAIVSFEYQHYRQYIIRQTEKDPAFLLFKMEPLAVTRAANPIDIYWNNLNVTDKARKYKVIVSYLVMFMTLTFAFGAVLGLDILKNVSLSYHPHTETGKKISAKIDQLGISKQLIQDYTLTIIITIFILLVNTALYYIILELTNFERHKTRTDQQLSLIIKLLISQFLNTALIYYIISRIQAEGFLSSKGLVIQVSSLIVISGVIQIFMNALHIPAMIRSALLWWKYRNLQAYDSVNLFQLRLNKEFQYIQFNLAQRYVYYLLQLYTALFYSYIVPIAIPTLIVIFFSQYWIDKFNLFYRSSLTTNFQFFLSKSVSRMFEFSLVIFAIGNFIFSFHLRNGHIQIINIITLSIAVLFTFLVIFASEDFERKLYRIGDTFQQFTYQSCVRSGKFQQTFWKQNPATALVHQQDISGHQNLIAKQNIIKTVVYKFGKQDQKTQQLVNRISTKKQFILFQ